MRGIETWTLLVMFFAAYPTVAQSNMTMPTMVGHTHVPPNVIDGAVTPEKIPDLPAYRLYLLAISKPAKATNRRVAVTHSHTVMVGLEEADRQALVRVADEFRYEYHNLIDTYNQMATEAWKKGQRTDIHIFLSQRDALVQATMANLKSSLTEKGWTRLDSHVQNEKKHMQISVSEVGQ